MLHLECRLILSCCLLPQVFLLRGSGFSWFSCAQKTWKKKTSSAGLSLADASSSFFATRLRFFLIFLRSKNLTMWYFLLIFFSNSECFRSYIVWVYIKIYSHMYLSNKKKCIQTTKLLIFFSHLRGRDAMCKCVYCERDVCVCVGGWVPPIFVATT